MKIFLLGFMGTGKSYWGKRWADQHDLSFFDLDQEVEESTGLKIPQIFEQYGEGYFREKERDQLYNFAKREKFILSTGGGTPCFFNNMQWMNQIGLTVYLKTPLPIIKERLVKEKSHRPLIRKYNEQEIEDFIKSSLQKRKKYYDLAHIILNTESITDITFDQIKKQYV